MTQRQIIVTDVDRDRLRDLLTSEFVQVIGPLEYLDDLKAELCRAKIVSPDRVPRNVVTMNSSVILRDLSSRERETYTLVFPEDADIAQGRLSVLAPVGTAILGQRIGDELKWRVPAGWRQFKIERILYQPEREGVIDNPTDSAPRRPRGVMTSRERSPARNVPV
jgi:regulator of nucleoside diphosphate kinase